MSKSISNVEVSPVTYPEEEGFVQLPRGAEVVGFTPAEGTKINFLLWYEFVDRGYYLGEGEMDLPMTIRHYRLIQHVVPCMQTDHIPHDYECAGVLLVQRSNGLYFSLYVQSEQGR